MRPLIVANWKMNTSLSEALILAGGIKEGIHDLTGVDVVICPPFPWLVPVAESIATHGAKHLSLGAQNIFWQATGTYTGEVSAAMLKGLVEYVIIGHSERRAVFHESNSEILAKVKLAMEFGLRPILCVGEIRKPSAELLADPSQLTASHVRLPISQLEYVVERLSMAQREHLVVAYEPVWAISGGSGGNGGNGKGGTVAASGHYANAVMSLLHGLVPSCVPILYGGSVKPDNAKEFLSQAAIGGLLVGGASLTVSGFVKICRNN